LQETKEQEKPGKLEKMLLKADDELVPKFLDALTENGQLYLANMLREPGKIPSDIKLLTDRKTVSQ